MNAFFSAVWKSGTNLPLSFTWIHSSELFGDFFVFFLWVRESPLGKDTNFIFTKMSLLFVIVCK